MMDDDYSSVVEPKIIDHDETIYWIMELERKQTYTAIAVVVFGTLWGLSKILPFAMQIFMG